MFPVCMQYTVRDVQVVPSTAISVLNTFPASINTCLVNTKEEMPTSRGIQLRFVPRGLLLDGVCVRDSLFSTFYYACSPLKCGSAHLVHNAVLLQLNRCHGMALQQQLAHAQVVHVVVVRVQS